MYEKIKKWYTQGLWTDEMVRAAADKGVITTENLEEIISHDDN